MNQEIETLKKDILHEITQIDKVLECIQKLNCKMTSSGVDIDNRTAMAGYLMNFYNGIENIFKRIAKEYYKAKTEGDSWHKDLLILVSEKAKDKPSVINKPAADKLYDYLGFRHFFVHGYSFMLEWENLNMLVNDIDNIWDEVKTQIRQFVNNI